MSQQQQTPAGTQVPWDQNQSKTTTNNSTEYIHNLCGMTIYANCNLDELRWEDYKKGNKGGSGTTAGFGVTGSTFGGSGLTGGGNTSFSFGSPGGGLGLMGAAPSTGFSFASQPTLAVSGPSFGTGSFLSGGTSVTPSSAPSFSFSTPSSSSAFSFPGSSSSGTGFTSGFSLGGSTSTASSQPTFSFQSSASQASAPSPFSFSLGGSSTPGFGFQSSSGGVSNAFGSTPSNFSFSSAPSQGTAPGFSFSSFGPTQLNPAQQQTFEASLTQDPYGKLPVFFENPGNIGSTAAAPATPAQMPALRKSALRASTPFYRSTPTPSSMKVRGSKTGTLQREMADKSEFVKDLFAHNKSVKKLVVADGEMATPLFRDKRKDVDSIDSTPQTPSVLSHSEKKTSVDSPIDYPSNTPIMQTPAGLKTPGIHWSDTVDKLQESTKQNIPTYSRELSSSDFEKKPMKFVSKDGYFIKPSYDELMKLDSLKSVPNFVIGREGIGTISFLEPVDLTGANINSIVNFEPTKVEVYSDDDTKPPYGQGLNRRAMITLYKCFPKTGSPGKESFSFAERLQKRCKKFGADFVSYKPDSGEWMFRVKHFSKYGVDDSDEEDNVPAKPPIIPSKTGTEPLPRVPQPIPLPQQETPIVKPPTLDLNIEMEESNEIETDELEEVGEDTEEIDELAMEENNLLSPTQSLSHQIGLDVSKMHDIAVCMSIPLCE